MEKDTTIEGVIEIIMNSDPMKRVLSLEQSSIITGRAPQYKGVTIQEVIRSALSAQKEEIEKGVRSNIGMLRQWLNEKDDKLMVTNEMIETFLFSITSNKEKK